VLVKLRLGCIGFFFLVGLALIVFWRPISKRMTDWSFEKTTAAIEEVLPADDAREARVVMEALLTTMKRDGVPREHAEEARAFQEYAFGMLKNNEVTEDEAREMVSRARALLEKLDPGALPE